jgi:MarR family transcriptional regulator for hemolysin
MIGYDFEKSVSYWVGLTAHLFETALNNELAGTGITLRQVQVLACLALYGEMSQSELALQIRIEPSTLVRILDRMERDEWIERRPSPEDRRKKIVHPTEKVVSKWATIIECGERLEKRAIAGLGTAQLKSLNDTLEVIRKNLDSETSSKS